jgi:glycogen debranching enzyme
MKQVQMNQIQTKQVLRLLLPLLFLAALYPASEQAPGQTHPDDLTLSTDASAVQRFVAVHGRRAVLMGYSEQGLEAWAYPFQILSDYRIGFRPQGSTTETDGRLLLRRVIYRPESVTRMYIGPNFIVNEKLFIPMDQAAAIVTYNVESLQRIDIAVHFTPVLNLMWPGALGGQSTAWNDSASGYVITQPSHNISAVIASPQIIAHDSIENSTIQADNSLAFTLRPSGASGSARATVAILLMPSGQTQASAEVRSLMQNISGLEAQSRAHYAELRQSSLRIQTPDEEVNKALAWANIALDQAWVCNPTVGCGSVGGYGPSRNQRRPQYDWFFAGDELIAVNSLLAAGQYSRAREELEFIAKYQDQKTGMVWHEISQSAGYIDWSKYPYMFVHVDISFDYLAVVAHYIAVTGDAAFAREHWPSIAAAYRYCQSLIPPQDHLPHIPAGKEGGNEQERPDDDLGLSSAWVAATSGFADLARLTEHNDDADEALEANRLARAVIASKYWDPAHHFWIDQHTASGQPVVTRRSGFSSAISQGIFSKQQNDELLDELASAEFRTDWGIRSVAADSSIFNPYSYAAGSVSALNSAHTALAFWKAHRPDVAFSLWRSILPWNTLDSVGHLHEVLAGNVYSPQMESVPEQSWSSAGLLDAAVTGLLGLNVDGVHKQLTFAPHLPADWPDVSVSNVTMPHSRITLVLHQSAQTLDLGIRNEGEPVKVLYQPRLPLGARVTQAEVNGLTVTANLQQSEEEYQARVEIEAPAGSTHCLVRFAGGVSVIVPQNHPQFGAESTGVKIRSVRWSDHSVLIDADFSTTSATSFTLKTRMKVLRVEGAALRPIAGDMFELRVEPNDARGNPSNYRRSQVEVQF